MSFIVRLATALSIAVLGISAFADDTGDSSIAVEIPTPEYVRLMLARDKAVHKELRLSADQQRKISTAVLEVDQPFWRLRDVPPARSAQELLALASRLRRQMDQTLSPEQNVRFEQLLMQARGARALAAPDLRQQLGLSIEQSQSIAALISEASGGTLSVQKLFEQLDPGQQSKLTDLFGPRFDLSQVSRIGCFAPEIRGVESWINSAPLTLESQRGKVVAVHFWAFGCINCIRNLPHYQVWYDKFPAKDFTIIGIHTPETDSERDITKLRANIAERDIRYPIAFDLNGENWKAWANNVWPSVYLIDRYGQVRTWWYGELNWQGATGEAQLRDKISALLRER
jgi:thiol-disulfide isomerase/thioredoxin